MSPYVLFYLSFYFDSYVFKIQHFRVRNLSRKPNNKVSEVPRQNKGRGLVDRKLDEAPSSFIDGRLKAAFLFWFFGDFRCGVLFFIVILDIYKYRNR